MRQIIVYNMKKVNAHQEIWHQLWRLEHENQVYLMLVCPLWLHSIRVSFFFYYTSAFYGLPLYKKAVYFFTTYHSTAGFSLQNSLRHQYLSKRQSRFCGNHIFVPAGKRQCEFAEQHSIRAIVSTPVRTVYLILSCYRTAKNIHRFLLISRALRLFLNIFCLFHGIISEDVIK